VHVSDAAAACTSTAMTAAPSDANSSAASRPMPLPAPVISATLCASLMARILRNAVSLACSARLRCDRIRTLLGQYCERIDAGDFEGVGALFARGCLADEHGNELARGSDAVAAFYAATVRLHDGSPRTKHLVTNTAIEEEDAGMLVARSSYVMLLQLVDGGPLEPTIAGRYVDHFERDGTGWHFFERRFLVDLSGDLSQHFR
jgi:hypothetical protein